MLEELSQYTVTQHFEQLLISHGFIKLLPYVFINIQETIFNWHNILFINIWDEFYFCSSGPDNDVDSAARYIQHVFQMQNQSPPKVIYPHFTTATDTSNIQVVFQVVMDSILRDNLKAAAIL